TYSFFFQAEDGIRDFHVTGVQTCALPIFKRKEYRTGQILQTCATNNVIIPVYVTRDLGLRFDETHPLAGGTDTLFFVEACARGEIGRASCRGRVARGGVGGA